MTANMRRRIPSVFTGVFGSVLIAVVPRTPHTSEILWGSWTHLTYPPNFFGLEFILSNTSGCSPSNS